MDLLDILSGVFVLLSVMCCTGFYCPECNFIAQSIAVIVCAALCLIFRPSVVQADAFEAL